MREQLSNYKGFTANFTAFDSDTIVMLKIMRKEFAEKFQHKVYFIFGDEFPKGDYRRLREFLKYEEKDAFEGKEFSLTVKREKNVYDVLYCFQKRKIEWLRCYENQFNLHKPKKLTSAIEKLKIRLNSANYVGVNFFPTNFGFMSSLKQLKIVQTLEKPRYDQLDMRYFPRLEAIDMVFDIHDYYYSGKKELKVTFPKESLTSEFSDRLGCVKFNIGL